MTHSKCKFLIATGFTLIIGCSEKHYQSLRWQANPITADGKVSEWKLPLRNYDKDSKLNYDITNDATNLYFIIKVTEQQMQMRIIHAGMDIAVDTAGKKNYSVVLAYPLPSSTTMDRASEANQPLQRPQPGERPNMVEVAKKMIFSQTQLHIEGFNGDVQNGYIPINNNYGIEVKIDWDKEGTMYYEGVIPFKTFFKNSITSRDTLKPMSFQITLEAIEPFSGGAPPDGDGPGGGGKMQGGPPGGGMQGGPPGGGGMQGGMGGSGMQGGPPGGRGPDAIIMPTKNTITFKRKLSFKNIQP